MAVTGQAYIEHVALYVQDIPWYLDFFKQTLGLTERMRKEENNHLKQIWLFGGLQLIERSTSEPQGQLAHLGIMVENQQETLAKILKYDVKQLPQGPNWIELPDGLQLEILQAAPNSVQQALNVTPW